MFKVAVLNPGGRDPDQKFPDFAGAPDEKIHAPVNYHGYAACTSGAFARDYDAIPRDTRAVILLLTHDLSRAAKAITRLRREKKVVALAWKEAGGHQIAEQIARGRNIELFRQVCEMSDGAVCSTLDQVPLFLWAGAQRAEFIPTPYPVEDPRWDFTRPEEEKRGVLIGTREFFTPTRNHFAALLIIRRLAEGLGEPVTVFNLDGWKGRRRFRQVGYEGSSLRVVEQRLPYPQYLRVVAKHRFVFQLDASTVPGQVAGDALLARVPCVGGQGTTERLVFPELCGHGRSHEQLFDIAARLFEHQHDCADVVVQAVENARATLSFPKVAASLESFFSPLLW